MIRIYEDMRSIPAEDMAETFRFLGVSAELAPEGRAFCKITIAKILGSWSSC
jgi:hypothetical protein